jgi:predicted kinase
MMSGLPASGKSTVAKSLQQEVYPDSIRVSKDVLRKMLHFGEYSWQNEKIVGQIEKDIVINALAANLDVIVDDTNLMPYHEAKWKNVAYDCDVMFIKATQTCDWEECCLRDSMRGDESVGSDVIKKFAMEIGQVQGKFVICDLDGTLCDITARRHFVTQEGKKDWKSFFEHIAEDELRADVAEKIRLLNEFGYKIVYLSGRPEDYKEQTLAWLTKHGVDFHFALIMRRKGDKREDTVIKKEFLHKYFPNKEQINCIIDDRPSVLRMWRSELDEREIAIIDVGDGVEF